MLPAKLKEGIKYLVYVHTCALAGLTQRALEGRGLATLRVAS